MNNYSKLTLVEVIDFDVASSGITRTLINIELMYPFYTMKKQMLCIVNLNVLH